MREKLPGRNDLCICGSGKKYKKCCMRSAVTDSGVNRQVHLNDAHQCMKKGELVRAERAFKQALKQDGANVDTLCGLGQCLYQQWRRKEGLQYLFKAGKLLLKRAKKALNVKDLLDFSYLLINLNESKEALFFINEAIKITPNFPRAHHTRAMALQKNDVDEALLSAQRAVDLAPQESNASLLLAVLEGKKGRLPSAKQRLQHLIAEGNQGTDRARAYHELGVIFNKLKEYDQAFSCFESAGQLKLSSPQAQRIDKEAVFRELEHSEQVFDKEYFHSRFKGVRGIDTAPVFLLGFYRSGTTLMEQVLGAHPSIITSDEAYIIPELAKVVLSISEGTGSLQEKIKSLNAEQIVYLRKAYWEIAEKMMGQKLGSKVFVDKTAMNIINLGLINTLFPDALVLFAVRDPRDVCISSFMQSFALSPLTIHFLSWRECVRFYTFIMSYWIKARDLMVVSWVELRYEDVVEDLEGQFRQVLQRIGLDWVSECEKFYNSAKQKTIKTPSFDQVTKPLYKTAFKRWVNYRSHIDKELAVLEPFVKQFGYEGE
jgi:tetratricopeptide (TPR) repeat protein